MAKSIWFPPSPTTPFLCKSPKLIFKAYLGEIKNLVSVRYKIICIYWSWCLLAAATNKAINDNASELFVELKPVLEDVINKVLEDLLFKTISNNIPWDELYPVNPKFQ